MLSWAFYLGLQKCRDLVAVAPQWHEPVAHPPYPGQHSTLPHIVDYFNEEKLGDATNNNDIVDIVDGGGNVDRKGKKTKLPARTPFHHFLVFTSSEPK